MEIIKFTWYSGDEKISASLSIFIVDDLCDLHSIWSSDLILHHITRICDYFATLAIYITTNKMNNNLRTDTITIFVKYMSLNGVDNSENCAEAQRALYLTFCKMQLQNMVINWKFSASLQMTEKLRWNVWQTANAENTSQPWWWW